MFFKATTDTALRQSIRPAKKKPLYYRDYVCVCVCVHVCVYVCVCVCMCVRVVSIDPLSVFDVYLYTERERVRESEREGDKRDLLYRQKRPAIQKKKDLL